MPRLLGPLGATLVIAVALAANGLSPAQDVRS
jgi:hypothetical protein